MTRPLGRRSAVRRAATRPPAAAEAWRRRPRRGCGPGARGARPLRLEVSVISGVSRRFPPTVRFGGGSYRSHRRVSDRIAGQVVEQVGDEIVAPAPPRRVVPQVAMLQWIVGEVVQLAFGAVVEGARLVRRADPAVAGDGAEVD